MKRITALAGALLALAGCSIPTRPSSEETKASHAKAMLEAASNVGVLAGRSLN